MGTIAQHHATSLVAIQDEAERKALNALKEINLRDPERAHGQADDILLEFITDAGFAEIADLYNNMASSAPWWGAG